MEMILLPPWWYGLFRQPRQSHGTLKPKEKRILYSDGWEYIERDGRGRMVAHVVERAGHQRVNERYEYRDGKRVVVERDGIPVDGDGGDPPRREG